MTSLWSALVCGLLSGTAHASNLALKPQIELHAGASAAPSLPDSSLPSLGFSAGMDSRMTRVISVDIGGFMMPTKESGFLTEGTDYSLRHGVYISPSLKIPHQQPDRFTWDVVVRGGMSVIWLADLRADAVNLEDTPYPMAALPAWMLGGDLQLMVDRWGGRISGRNYFAQVYDPKLYRDAPFQFFQVVLEGVIQF